MNRIFFPVFIATLSFLSNACNKCPKGFEGQDCSIEMPPKSIRVVEAVILKFPATRPDGTTWDPAANPGDEFPDVIISITRLAEHFAGNFVADADPAGTPYTIKFTTDFNSSKGKYSTDLSSLYKLRFYDFDYSAGDEFMAEIGFIFYENGMGFPNPLRVESADGLYACDLVLEYEY